MGKNYHGIIAHTITKKTCQRWDSQKPHIHSNTDATQFPDKTLGGAANFCRNPTGWVEGPWCYTDKSNTEWEICAVSMCDGNFIGHIL